MKKPSPLSARTGSRLAPAETADPSTMRTPSLAIKRLLVPIDFTEESAKPLQYAAAVAKAHRARVILLHVAPPISSCVDCGYGPVQRNFPNQSLVRRRHERLRRFAETHIQRNLIEDIIIRSGAIAEEINLAAQETGADLIILCSHTGRKLDELHSREIVEHVARQAPCPVMVVRSREHDFLRGA